jgi:hypothetical protein
MRYTITVGVSDPRQEIQAVKEAVACYCEQFGDLELVSVSVIRDKQETLWGGRPPRKEGEE